MSEPKTRSRANSDLEHKENSSEFQVSMASTFGASITSTLYSGSVAGKNESTEFKQGSKCVVCSKKFTLTSRRHHCRFCGESVCDMHSMKRRNKAGEAEKVRICDTCDKEFIKEEVRKEVEEEVMKLEKQVMHAREVNEKLYKEHY